MYHDLLSTSMTGVGNQRKKMKIKKMTSTVEELFTVVYIGATTTSVALSVTGVSLILVPIYAGIACAASLSNKILHEIILAIINENKTQYEKDQQIVISIDELYSKSLQILLIDKNERKSQ